MTNSFIYDKILFVIYKVIIYGGTLLVPGLDYAKRFTGSHWCCLLLSFLEAGHCKPDRDLLPLLLQTTHLNTYGRSKLVLTYMFQCCYHIYCGHRLNLIRYIGIYYFNNQGLFAVERCSCFAVTQVDYMFLYAKYEIPYSSMRNIMCLSQASDHLRCFDRIRHFKQINTIYRQCFLKDYPRVEVLSIVVMYAYTIPDPRARNQGGACDPRREGTLSTAWAKGHCLHY